jgi:uracil-DNA glycosylase
VEVKIEASWKELLQPEFDKPYFELLTSFVRKQYQQETCFPPAKLIFNAYNLCPFDQVKVVIIGQDPYHNVGQANGLCFSVNDGVPFPPSLHNIFKEIQSDLHIAPPVSGNLERWAKQGVLLLNAILTVRLNEPGSHQNKGWEDFTDTTISLINERKKNVVFILWGNYAQQKGKFIDKRKHCVLMAPHPSPLSASRGFFGCHHFSQANAYLQAHHLSPIAW